MMLRILARFRLLTLPLLLTGCYTFATGSSFEDPRRFSHRPDEARSVEPVAKVNETLYGLDLFGFRVKGFAPEKLREEYLSNPNYRVTNWQLNTTTIAFPYVHLIFTVPRATVKFDVVEVQ